MDQTTIDRLMRRQTGVVSRRQLLTAGADDRHIARQLRRREWRRIHEGVYVNHTGPPTRAQRDWAAVLVHAPAALAGASALRTYGVDAGEPVTLVEVAVDRSRRVADPVGVRTTQLRSFAEHARLDDSPPRLRLETAALLVASRSRTEDGAVAVLADAVGGGRTTAFRLGETLAGLTRLPRRRLLADALADVGAGAMSPLELRYLRDVERRHRLPTGSRQVHEAIEVVLGERIQVVRRDVRYPGLGTIVELDGRLGHTAAIDRWADLDRDLAAAVHGSITLRVGWQQVVRPCRLAAMVGTVLHRRGWPGPSARCGPECPARLA